MTFLSPWWLLLLLTVLALVVAYLLAARAAGLRGAVRGPADAREPCAPLARVASARPCHRVRPGPVDPRRRRRTSG